MAEEKPIKRAHNFKDLTNQQFGYLTVLSLAPSVKKGRTRWLCRCDCGNRVIVEAAVLQRGDTKRCRPCANKMVRTRMTTHGMTRTKEYNVWVQAKERCFNPKNTHYASYGGRGITMCPQWKENFETFLADMGHCPDGLTLDRIDNDRGYEPGNCRWTDLTTQMRNRQNSLLITHNGETLHLKEWSLRLGVRYGTLWLRLKEHGPEGVFCSSYSNRLPRVCRD